MENITNMLPLVGIGASLVAAAYTVGVNVGRAQSLQQQHASGELPNDKIPLGHNGETISVEDMQNHLKMKKAKAHSEVM